MAIGRTRGILVRGAAAIMSGLSDAPRAAGADIRIRGSTIVEVGSLAPEPGEHVIDATGCLVYPGWVNTHHHLLQSLMKGVPGGMNATLGPWLQAVPFAFRMRFDAELLETAALLGLAELMLSGCTTVADFHNLYYPGIPYDGAEVLFDTAERLGLRLVLCRGIGTRLRPVGRAASPTPCRPKPLLPRSPTSSAPPRAGTTRRRHRVGVSSPRRRASRCRCPRRSCASSRRRRVAWGCGCTRISPRAATTWCIAANSMIADRWNLPRIWESSGTTSGSRTLSTSTTTTSAFSRRPAPASPIARAAMRASATVSRRILAMRETGVRISLGQDGGAANEPGDMIADAHLAWYLHRTQGGPQALSIEEVIHWGTRGGADILGLDSVGAIAPGYEADLAIYRLDDIRFAAFHDVAIAPVATGVRPRLECLMVGGRIVVEHDRILGIDLDDLRQRVCTALQRLTG